MSEQSVKNETPTKPLPPQKPLATDCCETGCNVCVFDAYVDALHAYERALAEWQEQHAD